MIVLDYFNCSKSLTQYQRVDGINKIGIRVTFYYNITIPRIFLNGRMSLRKSLNVILYDIDGASKIKYDRTEAAIRCSIKQS